VPPCPQATDPEYGFVREKAIKVGGGVLDTEGRFSRPLYLGGPRALMPAALEAVSQWRARPVRVKGVPIVNPMVVQVPLRR
jgi:hypothetical protein